MDVVLGKLRDLPQLGVITTVKCECGNTSGRLLTSQDHLGKDVFNDVDLVVCTHCFTVFKRVSDVQ